MSFLRLSCDGAADRVLNSIWTLASLRICMPNHSTTRDSTRAHAKERKWSKACDLFVVQCQLGRHTYPWTTLQQDPWLRLIAIRYWYQCGHMRFCWWSVIVVSRENCVNLQTGGWTLSCFVECRSKVLIIVSSGHQSLICLSVCACITKLVLCYFGAHQLAARFDW